MDKRSSQTTDPGLKPRPFRGSSARFRHGHWGGWLPTSDPCLNAAVVTTRNGGVHTATTGKLSVHHQGNRCVLEHVARDAAQDQLAEPRMRIGAHHE